MKLAIKKQICAHMLLGIILILLASCDQYKGQIIVSVFGDNDPEINTGPKCPTTLVQGLSYTCPTGVKFVDIDSAGLNQALTVYTLGTGNTCAWASVDPTTGEIFGSPNDDQSSNCELEVSASDGTKTVSNKITLSFINVRPTLTISDTTSVEDSGLITIRSDLDVQSDEEGFGVYSLDNGATTSPKCSDNGVLTIDSNTGSIDYNPALNYTGTCNIKVIFDDQNISNNIVSTEFKLTVTNVNDVATVSNSCATSLNEDSAYTCTPIVSDPDPSDVYTWSLDPSTTCSWASISPSTGVISGTPNDDEVGSCSITYKTNDGSVDSNNDTINITINNLQPTLTIGNTSINEDAGLTVIRSDASVQASDEGYGVYAIDNTTTTIPKCSDNGVVTIDSSTGEVSFNPTTNYYGSCNIKVVFDDQNLTNNTVSTEFAVNVNNVNDAPVVSNSCATSTNEDSLYSCTPLSNDVDVADTATWSLDSSNTCSWVSINSSTGVISGTPNDNQVGTCNLAFKANDSIVDSNVDSFTLTITNVQPTLAISNTTISEDDVLAIIRDADSVQASDEGYGVYSLDNTTTTAPKCSDNGLVSIDANTGEISYAPSLNFNGNCNIKVQFDDENSVNNLVTAQFAVTVTPVNDTPTILFSCLPTSTCGNNLIGTVNSTTGAVEIFNGNNDMSNTQICFMPSGAGYNIFKASTSTFPRTDYSSHTNLNLDDDDSAEQTLLSAVKLYGNSYSSIWIGSNGYMDNLGSTDYSPSDFDFNNKIVVAPFWKDLNPSSQGAIYFKEENDRIIATWDNVTDYGETSSNNAQIEIYKSTGEIIITYGTVETVNNSYVGISNAGGNYTTFNFNGGVTTTPTIVAMNEDTNYSCSPIAVDVDGDTLTWSILPSSTCAWATINSTTGEVSGTPIDDQVGNCSISFKVNDGTVDSSTKTDNFQINNLQPTLSIADATMNEDAGLSIIRTDADVQASDESWGYYDLDNITVTTPACDDNGSLGIDPTSGQITFNPSLNYNGICYIKVEFNDENSPNNLIADEFALTVSNVNDAPVISSTCSTTTTEGSAYSCTPSVTDPDTGDTQTWALDASNTCAWAAINSTTGAISGTPNDDQVGNCTLAFKSNDANLDSNIQTYSIDVTNGVPQLVIANASIYQDSPATVIRTDAEVQSNNEGSGVYSLDNANATVEKCSDHGSVSIDSSTGQITYTPTPGYVGDCHVKVVFDDQHPTNNIGTTEFIVTVMDNIGPSPISLDSSGSDQTYGYGQVVQIQVHFNENVFVDTTGGTPKFKLETGTIDKFAVYASGSGTTDLTFEYLVGIGDASSDLDTHPVFNSIELSGGTIRDNFDNDVVSLVLPVTTNVNSLSSNRNIIIDTNIDYANFSGQPTRVSAAIVLNIDVFGDNLTVYKYKVQSTSTIDCSDSTGYSGEVNIATNITDNISSFSNGTNLTICIVGKNSVGNWQPYSLATQYMWTKDKYAITILDFTAIDNIPTFKDAAVAPNNDAIIYARNLKGEMLRTTDSGTTWKLLCKLPSSYSSSSLSSIHVSAGDDYTAYITLNNDIYRVDDLLGANCLNMTTSHDSIFSSYISDSLTLHPSKSELYAWSKDTVGSKLIKSIDRGESWVTLINHTFYDGEFGTIAINPSNDQNMASYRWDGDDFRDGYYFSNDGGTSWTFYSLAAPSGVTVPRSLVWNPLNTSYIYGQTPNLETPYYSSNNGSTWSTTNGLPTSVRWTIDGQARVYFLKKVGFNTSLERSTPITTPNTTSYSSIYTFNNLRGIDSSSQSISVSNSGNTMAALIENRLFLSFDSGVSFTEVTWKGSKTAELHSVTTEDGGQTIYGVTPNWSVVKTTDGGQNWTYQYSYHQHCNKLPRIRVSPVSSNNVLIWPDNFDSSTNCSNVVFSNDGMNSASFSENGINANYSLLAMSPVDQERFFYIGSNLKYRTTKDGGISWIENSSLWSTTFLPESYSHPTISDLVWVGDTSSTGTLWEYDTQNNTRINITSRLGMSSLAGFNVVKSNGGDFLIRAISKTGIISESTDNAQSFTPKTTISPLSSCSRRLFYTHPKDFNVVTTACAATNKISFSRDAGNSWIEMDLNALYGINCGIRGVAIHLSKLFIACTNSESLMLNYTPLELVNDVYDGVLSSTEISNTNDLIVNINEAGFVTIEYAVIPAASVCNQTVTNFTTTIPKSNDSAFSADGNYKVCAKLTDTLGVDFYETSSIFTVDTVVPTFTSIDLVDEASDAVVKYFEHYKNIKPLVGNLVAVGHDTVLYSLVPSTTVCNDSITYEQSVPSHYSKNLTVAGNYKVCVKLTDYAGHPAAFGESPIFNFSPIYAFANITGLPSRVTRDKALNIAITGDIVTKYKYKIGLSSSVNCNDSSGYSSDVAIATNITDSLTSYNMNDVLRLCVIGSNATDDWQPYQFATEYKFSTSNISIEYLTASNMFLPYWQDVAISPIDENTIYAKSLFNEIYKSEDGGTNWELQCEIDKDLISDTSLTGNLFVSKGSDKTAYLAIVNDLYRIERVHGGNCTNLTSGFSNMYNGSYVTRSATTDTNGNLYFWEEKTGIGLNLWKSVDQGERFNLITTHTAISTYYARMEIDPNDSNNMIMIRGQNTAGQGVYRSTDGGANWTFITSTPYQETQSPQFLPGNSQYIFVNDGFYSTNGGLNWTSGGTTNYMNNSRFYLDGIAGYRFKDVAGGVELQRSADLTTLPPTWSGIKSLPKGQNDSHGKAISANATKIAIVSEGRLHISNNTGSSWTEIKYPNSNLRASDFAINKSQNKIYAALHGMRLIASNDSGANWNFQAALLESNLYVQELGHTSVSINPLNENQIIMTTFGLYGQNYWPVSITSTDDFATYQFNSSSSSQSFNSYGFDKVHSGNIHRYTPSTTISTFENYGSSSETTTTLLNFPNSNSANTYHQSLSIYPSNKNAGLIFTTSKAYRYQTLHRSWSEITSNLVSSVLPNIAGNEVFRDSDGQYKIRAISNTGRMAISEDNGTTWGLQGLASPSIGTCSLRMIKTNIHDPNTIITYCPDGELVSITNDKGNNWTHYNLSNYGLNCKINHIEQSLDRIFIGCSSDYGLILKLNSTQFSSLLADGVLSTSDKLAASDLISPTPLPNFYTGLKYKIVPSSTACDNSLTYSAIIPKSDAAELSTSGDYKICIEITDTSSNITYESTHEFRVDQVAPTFSSISLTGAASDGLVTYNEKLDDPYSIVNNLIGSNYDYASFVVVESSTVCDGSLTYSLAIPSSDSEAFLNSGTYKVCVKLTDIADNTPAYGSSALFSYNSNELIALLNNLPEMVTNISSLNINISGPGISHYRYKIGSSSLTNCADQINYSAEIPIATPITNSILGYSNNSSIKICVIGTNGSNISQPLLKATSHNFVRNKFIMRYYSFNGVNYEVGWNLVEVAPGNPSIIYAEDNNGLISKSIDAGATWSELCKINPNANGHLKVSNDGSKAYVSDNSRIYFVTDNNGSSCKYLKDYWGTNLKANFDVYPNGDLLILDIPYINGSKQYYFYKYSNDTQSIEVLSSLNSYQSGGNYNSGYIAIDQINPNNIIWNNPYNTNWGWVGFNISNDGGKTWTSLNTIGNSSIAYKYDPANADYIYTNYGSYSNDGGFNFTTAAGYITSGESWSIEQSGKAYHLKGVGSDTVLETSPDMLTPNWSDLTTFTGIASSKKHTSSASSTITVIIGNRLFISSDSGTTFNEVVIIEDVVRISTVDKVGNTIYAGTPDWTFLKSTDNGLNWTKINSATIPNTKPPYLRVSPSNANQVNVMAQDGTSTYSTKSIFTHDGFSTMKEGTDSINTYYSMMSISPSDENIIYFVGNSTSRFSTDAGETFTQTSSSFPNVWSSSYSGWVSPIDNDLLYVVGGNSLWEHDQSTMARSDIKNNLTFIDPAGVDMYYNGSTWSSVIISNYGLLNESTDNYSSFSSIGSQSTHFLYSCSDRHFKVLQENPQVMITACIKGSSGAYTIDGGTTWNEFSITNSLPIPTSCTIKDLEIYNDGTNNHAIISCENLNALEILF